MPPLNEQRELTRPWVRTDERFPRPLRLASAQREQLSRWVDSGYPDEVCGILVGRTTEQAVEVIRVTQARNLETDRTRDRFRLAPEDWLAVEQAARGDGLEVVGIWHSHPDHPPLPSRTDLAAAWEGYAYLIASVGPEGARKWRSWQLVEGVFVEQDLED